MKKSFCKTLQSIDMNKTVTFGVCKAAEVEISDKLNAFKDLYYNLNPQMQIDKMQ